MRRVDCGGHAGRGAWLPTWLAASSLLVVPVLVWTWALALRASAGPNWLGCNVDPTYAYLFNSLSLSEGLQVGHSDHPGATLQWLGAAVLPVTHALVGRGGTLRHDVLSNPELFLAAIHHVLVAIMAVSVAVSGLVAWRATGSLVAGWLMQIAPFGSGTARDSLYHVTPEPLLLTLAILLGTAVLLQERGRQHTKRTGLAVLYGMVAGFGLALKINFAPLCVLPIVLLRGLRQRLVYGVTALVLFALLVANPRMDVGQFGRFLLDIIRHEGYSERGGHRVNAPTPVQLRVAQRVMRPLRAELPMLLIVGSFVACGVPLFRSHGAAAMPPASWNRRMWWAIVLVFGGQVAVVALGPDPRLRYLCPVTGLLGTMAALTWSWSASLRAQGSNWLLLRGAPIGAILGGLLLALCCLPGDRHQLAARAAAWSEAPHFLEAHGLSRLPLINYYTASSRPFALSFGNSCARRHFCRDLVQRFPKYYRFTPMRSRLHLPFAKQGVYLESLFGADDVVLLQGDTRYAPRIPTPAEYALARRPTAPDRRKTGKWLPVRDPAALSVETLFEGSVETIVAIRRRVVDGPATPSTQRADPRTGKDNAG